MVIIYKFTCVDKLVDSTENLLATPSLAWSSVPILHSTCVLALLKQSQFSLAGWQLIRYV